MSDISRANENYKYLIVCVDVFSRIAFVVPMKNKQMSSSIESVEEVLDNTSPNIINCDDGSEFTNHLFKKFIRDRGREILITLMLEIFINRHCRQLRSDIARENK